MRSRLYPVILTVGSLLVGTNPAGIVHAATPLTIDNTATQYGFCDQLDPITTANNQSVSYTRQEGATSPGPGDWADISTVTVTPGVTMYSVAPRGADSNGQYTIQNFPTQSNNGSSPNAGQGVPAVQITVNLCGALPTNPVFGKYTGVAYYVYFQTAQQETRVQTGVTSTGGAVHDGPYPSQAKWQYFTDFSLTNGVPDVSWGMFDPIGFLTFDDNNPDVRDLEAGDPTSPANPHTGAGNAAKFCAMSLSGDSPCLHNDNGYPSNGQPPNWYLNAWLSADRTQVNWLMPYTQLTTNGATIATHGGINALPGSLAPHKVSSRFTAEPLLLGGGDSMNNVSAQTVVTYEVQLPQPVLGLYNLVGELFTADWAPGYQFCDRLHGTIAPDPTHCGQTPGNSYAEGTVGGTLESGGIQAVPNPLQREVDVDRWTYYPCGTPSYTDAYPGAGPAGGGTGQDTNGGWYTDYPQVCAHANPAQPEADAYSEPFNQYAVIWGRIPTPGGPVFNATGLSATT